MKKTIFCACLALLGLENSNCMREAPYARGGVSGFATNSISNDPKSRCLSYQNRQQLAENLDAVVRPLNRNGTLDEYINSISFTEDAIAFQKLSENLAPRMYSTVNMLILEALSYDTPIYSEAYLNILYQITNVDNFTNGKNYLFQEYGILEPKDGVIDVRCSFQALGKIGQIPRKKSRAVLASSFDFFL